MVTLLFLVILVIYIGLGIPDSALGASWPALYIDLGFNIGYQSIISILISLGTVGASFFSAKLINKFGTQLVTAVSTALTALMLLGFALSNSLIFFCLLAIPLGIGAGAIDAALNNYVAINYGSKHMNFLHAFYGVGVGITPYIFSLTLANNNDWRGGYKIIFIIQISLALIAFLSLPLWKKVNQKKPEEEKFAPKTLTLKQMVKIPALKPSWLLFYTTCALEFTFGAWGCTYLVNTEGLTESNSALFLTLYYVGISASRLISGFFAKKFSCGKILSFGCALIFCGILLLFLPIPPQIKGLSMLFVGLGNGPTFPNAIYLTPYNFGKENSQSIIGTQMVACNLGILTIPPLFGLLIEKLTTSIFPYFTAFFFISMVTSIVLYQIKLKKLNKSLFTFY